MTTDQQERARQLWRRYKTIRERKGRLERERGDVKAELITMFGRRITLEISPDLTLRRIDRTVPPHHVDGYTFELITEK